MFIKMAAAVGLIVGVIALTAGVAAAQYGGGGGVVVTGPSGSSGSSGASGSSGSSGGGSGGNGNGISLGEGSQTVAPGGTDSISLPTGPFTSGTPLTFFILFVEPGQSPQQVGTGTAGSDGGFSSSSFTVPAGAAAGGYIVFAEGESPDGLEVVDVAFVVVPSQTAAPEVTAASVFSHQIAASGLAWVAPTTWGTPALRQVVTQAVSARVQTLVGGAAPASNLKVGDLTGPQQLAISPTGSASGLGHSGSGDHLVLPLAIGGFLGLVGLAGVTMRRRLLAAR